MKITPLTLTDRTRTSIEQAIAQNEFGECLPPERRLCESLGVSRPVLREALAELEKEGVIKLVGRRRYIADFRRRKTDKPITHVRLLCRQIWEAQANEAVQTWEYLAVELANIHLEFHLQAAPACYGTNPKRHLEQLTASSPHTCWVLFRTTSDIQKWFQDSALPAVVFGGNHPDINLPSIDTDYESTCRHTAGLLAARGHRNVALIKRNILLPGDQASLDGFVKAWQSGSKDAGKERKSILMEHDGTKESIGKVVDRLLALKDTPTAWFIFGQLPFYFTIASRLAQHGIKVGQDIHLVCRDFDPYFDILYPKVACYCRNENRLRKKLCKMITAVAAGNIPNPQSNSVVAEFVDGDSLGKR